MAKVIRGVRYRKWKSPNGGGSPQRRRYAGRVHLQFYDRLNKCWRFVCGKRDLEWGAPGATIEDETPVTCLGCNKQAPEVVEHMDTVPDLEEFQ